MIRKISKVNVRTVLLLALTLGVAVAGMALASCSSSAPVVVHHEGFDSIKTRHDKSKGGSNGVGKDNPQQAPAERHTHAVHHASTSGETCVSPSVASGTSGCAPTDSITHYDGGWYKVTGPDTYIGSIRPPDFTGGEPKAPMNQPSSQPSNSGTYKNGVPVQSCLNDPYTQGCPGGPNGPAGGSDHPTGCTTAANGQVSCSGG
jgi:hypothetical protein